MPKLRGVTRAFVTLDLSDGDWIQIKADLTAGDERDITGKSIRGYSDGGKRVDIDPEKLSFMTAATYITAWSLLDQDGRAIVWPANGTLEQRLDVLRSKLSNADMREIDDAISAYRTRRQEELEKNGPGSATGTPPSSPSAD